MQFLPVVERELLVAARKPGTYWSRTLSAGILLAFFNALLSANTARAAFTGAHILQALSAVVFFECMMAGVRYTSDCLSEEKREGTLGLLFLTHLSGLDIVLGKMIARSVGALFNLVAVIPVMALTVLVGGVTGMQVAALAVSFGVAIIFSLCAGAFISSRGARERTVLVGTVAFLLAVTFLPLAISSASMWVLKLPGLSKNSWVASLTFSEMITGLKTLSPFHLYREAERGFTPQMQSGCWILLGISAGLLLYASWRIRHSFGKPEKLEERQMALATNRPRPGRSADFRRNPILWLALRSRTNVWLACACGVGAVCFGIIGRIALERKWGAAPPIIVLGSYGIHLLYKFLVTAETTRQLNEDKRSGALELLLTSPIPPSEIVRGQIKATRRTWAPVAVCVALMNLVWMSEESFQRDIGVVLPCSLALLFFDSYTLAWRAVLAALEGGRYSATVFKSFLRVMGPPVAVLGIVLAVQIGRPTTQDEMASIFFSWTVACIVYDLILMKHARTALSRMRAIAAGDKGAVRFRNPFRARTEKAILHGREVTVS